MKKLEGVKVGDFIYNEGGDMFFVYNINETLKYPVQIVKLNSDYTDHITKDGRLASQGDVQFFGQALYNITIFKKLKIILYTIYKTCYIVFKINTKT